MSADSDPATRCGDGVLYCATGDRGHLEEAVASAESVKACCPGLSVTLFTERRDFRAPCFDEILPVDAHVHTAPTLRRIQAMLRTPYRNTLQLDTDTRVVSRRLAGVFRLLDRFDIGLTHAPGRVHKPIDGIPESFPECNGGFILYRACDAVMQALARWEALVRTGEHGLRHVTWQREAFDQVPLRHVLWHSDLRIHVLPPEYNSRARFNRGQEEVMIHDRERIRAMRDDVGG